jgi:hypothetical protein
LKFVASGQIIEKLKGEDEFVLRNEHGDRKTFSVPDCRLKREE